MGFLFLSDTFRVRGLNKNPLLSFGPKVSRDKNDNEHVFVFPCSVCDVS